jgi:hypothetical protein
MQLRRTKRKSCEVRYQAVEVQDWGGEVTVFLPLPPPKGDSSACLILTQAGVMGWSISPAGGGLRGWSFYLPFNFHFPNKILLNTIGFPPPAPSKGG